MAASCHKRKAKETWLLVLTMVQYFYALALLRFIIFLNTRIELPNNINMFIISSNCFMMRQKIKEFSGARKKGGGVGVPMR